ncbi:polysaccharide ABC exporter membrane-spanning protein [Faecalicoccus pleomorphus]|uniref:Transport permease protein n=1 Tax=Faecalicoccus pleomorphus TaxID=1323 RepID=A0A380LLF4_9FIRM|nr:ABC transporter permease [Faecalicoccus pleomorphus]SUO04161.1 polysaccharide ABC exporter membrane-spanning protein [Faecalicoccus pleomorphus]
MQIWKDIYSYRELLKTNVKKDIRGKYKGSFLGVLWSFLNPLLQVVVYWIVFPFIMGRAGTADNYLCYLVTGIIPWTFFTSVVNAGTVSMITNAGIIKKVYFPREILLISQALSGIINFFISCIIVVIFCIGTGAGISYHLILLPVIAVIEMILSLGVIFILSALEVYVQDIEYVVSFLLNMGFYAAPILYQMSVLDGAGLLQRIISLNPFTVLIEGYRDIFMYHQWPDFTSLFMVLILSLVILIVGYGIFKTLEKGFAEKL